MPEHQENHASRSSAESCQVFHDNLVGLAWDVSKPIHLHTNYLKTTEEGNILNYYTTTTSSDHFNVQLHWYSKAVTVMQVIKPIQCYTQMQTNDDTNCMLSNGTDHTNFI